MTFRRDNFIDIAYSIFLWVVLLAPVNLTNTGDRIIAESFKSTLILGLYVIWLKSLQKKFPQGVLYQARTDFLLGEKSFLKKIYSLYAPLLKDFFLLKMAGLLVCITVFGIATGITKELMSQLQHSLLQLTFTGMFFISITVIVLSDPKFTQKIFFIVLFALIPGIVLTPVVIFFDLPISAYLVLPSNLGLAALTHGWQLLVGIVGLLALVFLLIISTKVIIKHQGLNRLYQ